MDNLKKQHEKAAGERFITAYNAKIGCNYFLKSEGEAPDLTYEDPSLGSLGVEIVTAYYNEQDAKGNWDITRGKSTSNSGAYVNPDQMLGAFINKEIRQKCRRFSNLQMSLPCLLVCDGRPPITDETDVVRTVLPQIKLPKAVPFAEIWLGLDLPHTSRCAGGYRIWRIHPRP